MANLLIIGGTGLVGSAIIREAQQYRHLPYYHNKNILALSRTANSRNSYEGVSFVQGNALEPQSLKIPFELNPNVVHTVGTLFEQSKYGDNGTYDRLNRDAAINVAETMASKYDGKQRRCFIYFSAANAPPENFLGRRYLEAKREAEQLLLGNAEFKEKIRVVVFRPGNKQKLFLCVWGVVCIHTQIKRLWIIGIIYSYHRRQITVPFAMAVILGSAILKPLSSYVPTGARYLMDRPLSDTEIAHAVFEALEDTQVEGICEIDRIRQLATQWEKKKSQ